MSKIIFAAILMVSFSGSVFGTNKTDKPTDKPVQNATVQQKKEEAAILKVVLNNIAREKEERRRARAAYENTAAYQNSVARQPYIPAGRPSTNPTVFTNAPCLRAFPI